MKMSVSVPDDLAHVAARLASHSVMREVGPSELVQMALREYVLRRQVSDVIKKELGEQALERAVQ